MGHVITIALGVVLGLFSLTVATLSGPSPARGVRFPEPIAPGPMTAGSSNTRKDVPRKVVLIVFDGLAPAMVDAAETPNLDRMAREGSWTRHMVPPFPSISLTGGFTLSTGCWPAKHGIMTNRFFDPERGFYDHSRDADWLMQCESLHRVAERQHVPTATLGWYGEVSGRDGETASWVDYHSKWSDYPSDGARAEQIVRHLQTPDGPSLILAYGVGPDDRAHFTGMDSEETRAAVRRADAAVGRVMSAIEEGGHPVALLVTTDHGMVPAGEMINVERMLFHHDIDARVVATGTTAFVYLDDPTTRDRAIAELSTYDEFDVLDPRDPPEWFHLGTGPRVGDFIVSARPPFVIEDRGQWPAFARWLAWFGPNRVDTRFHLHASHGYPPTEERVHGVFYAWGDGISSGGERPRIDAVDVHPTVTALLGISPGVPVDGSTATDWLESDRP